MVPFALLQSQLCQPGMRGILLAAGKAHPELHYAVTFDEMDYSSTERLLVIYGLAGKLQSPQIHKQGVFTMLKKNQQTTTSVCTLSIQNRESSKSEVMYILRAIKYWWKHGEGDGSIWFHSGLPLTSGDVAGPASAQTG